MLVESGGDAPQRWGELEEAALADTGSKRIDLRDADLAGAGEEEGPDLPEGPGRGGRQLRPEQ